MIEIVNIEKTTYDKFVGQFESFVKKMTEMGNRGTNKCLGDWLDNDEVCRNLKISKRTLQTLRDNGTLAYSRLVIRLITSRRTWTKSCRMSETGRRVLLSVSPARSLRQKTKRVCNP